MSHIRFGEDQMGRTVSAPNFFIVQRVRVTVTPKNCRWGLRCGSNNCKVLNPGREYLFDDTDYCCFNPGKKRMDITF